MKVAFYTLGCKLNFAESSYLAKRLYEAGYTKASAADVPDMCVINTCTVTDAADRKGRQLIHKIHRKYPDAYIIVTGCYAQLKPEEISQIEGVDLVLGANDKFQLSSLRHSEALAEESHNTSSNRIIVSDTKHLTPFHPAVSSEGRTRHFLKIQDGCDCFCTYCAIPFARGRSRSGTIAEVVKMAEDVAHHGGKEIILTGVNIGDFGKHTGETFLQLITQLDEVEGIERFRISSIEPDLLTDEIIEFVALSKRFAPHFHIPLQCGSDEVLKLMHRRYDTALFAERIHRIKQLMPDAFIGVDMIAGMRGETPELFEDSYRFITSLPVTRLHVFPYSERTGTLALKIPYSNTPAEKQRRVKVLMDWSAVRLKEFCNSFAGTTHKVLWEAVQKGGMMFGFTDNYIRVCKPYNKASINTIEAVNLTEGNIVIED
ncbi:MAG: tRNA (N(6)-L-threonylcarbamoyladenosine(37)-C(2))-methylthiotransferase MtaB [Paludibacteraceae bacterium]|nr:tRNA (N(6)-L-threonylcarbamoyladenosine(37)-C(2))-methylthiotransferase MtaB [Paludibacteraceae bacterium]